MNAGNERPPHAKEEEKKLCMDKLAQKGNKCLMNSLLQPTTPGW